MTKQETFTEKGTVLLVDDDPIFCTVSEAVLENLCFTVFVAEGGNEAVALFQKHHNSIDCLLTDLSMPDMNGWETLAALRKIKPDLPAILSSGYDEALAMKGDYKERPQAFLHKPYTRDGLKNLLNRVLVDATNRTAGTLADNEKISAMIEFSDDKDVNTFTDKVGDLKENIMAEKQKSHTYNIIFDASSEKFIPEKNVARLKRPCKTVSGATVEKAYLVNGIEAKVLKRELNNTQNNIFWESLVGKITSLVDLFHGSVRNRSWLKDMLKKEHVGT